MSRHGTIADENIKFQLVMPLALRAEIQNFARRDDTPEASGSEVIRNAVKEYMTARPAPKKRGRR